MSSWAQQREAIRRAAQGGVRARTNAQGSQRLPLANNRLREVLLSRPNGELTRAGQFYYGLVGGRPPSRQFDEEQPLIREGPTDYILLRSGVKKAVRSLQPDGSYHLTKLGKSFFREKYTDWLAHVPVRITGTRQRGRNAGRPYQRDDFLPITVVNGSLSRQSSGLSDQQAHARVKEAALRQLDSPNDGDPIMELSQEVYRYDATRDWAFSKQTLEVVDNRAQVQVALRQPMGALREISYQLYNGSEILPSAFEVRNDKLCVARQLAELLQLPLPEVLSRPHVLRQLPRRAPGRLPASGQGEPGRGLHVLPGARVLLQVGPGVSHCDDTPRNEGLYRGDRKETTVPPFSEWRPWAGRVESGHFWADDLRSVRAALLPQGHHPKVTMRSLCDWRALRRRHAVPRGRRNPPGLDAEAGPEYRGQRLARPSSTSSRRSAWIRGAAGTGCWRSRTTNPSSAPPPSSWAAASSTTSCPCTRPWRASPRCCRPCAWSATGPRRSWSPPACLESRVCRSVHEAYVQSPRPPALVCKLAKCDPDRICHGVDVVRRPGQRARGRVPAGDQVAWAHFKWSLDATAHVEPRCLAQALEVMEDAWPEGEEHMAKLSVNALIGLWARNQDLVYSMRTSNHELDGQGCQWRQTFTDAAGKVHWDHIYATELFSNYTLRPLHDYVMAQEHVAVAKIRDHLCKVPPRYVVALKTDCLVFQDLPKKFLPAVRELTARKHQDGTPVHRFEECKRLEGEYREPRIEAPYLTCYGPEWRRVEDPLLHCLNGKSLLLSAGRRTWRARSWRSSASSGRWSSSSPRPTAPCRTWAPERKRRTASSAGASATGAASWTGSSSRRSRSWTPASGPTSRSCP